MKYLNHHDWQTLISAIETLHSDFDPQTLTQRTLAAASNIIAAADSVAFTGFSWSGVNADLVWANVEAYSPEEIEILAAHIHENPLFEEYIIKHSAETLKITDLISPDKFERTAVYNEFYKNFGISNQLVTPMRISDEMFISCSINSKHRDFSERDKEVLTLIAPHLASAIRNAFAYQRLSAALDTEACGIVALSSQSKAVFISEFARLVFAKYFAGEKFAADDLPETLSDWIKKINLSVRSNEFNASPSPLKISNQNGELTVRLAFNKQTGERTLMLEEKRFAAPEAFLSFGLTKRESEILFWITQGKSDEIIARLCGISPRTVHKHVQNIYVKLGVETRTAAMLRALEIL